MVRVSSMLLGVALSVAAAAASAASAATSAYDALPAFAVPAFDYETLGAGDAPERLLRELQANGIVALQNVPGYAGARARYLEKAAACAVAASSSGSADENVRFLSQKTFADGTRRLTISTNAGAELADAAVDTQSACPGYRELYQQFSQIVERAVTTFGSTLDATSFSASDGAGAAISARKLVSEAIRLDHFHAYQAAMGDGKSSLTQSQSQAQTRRELSLSLPLHEDHGLFIAMSAPKFFEVVEPSAATGERTLVERHLAADRSGLVIQTAAGQRVRPVLNEDEVVIMMGTGASRWLQTSHALPAVLHGMKMPERMLGQGGEDAGRRSLRAWFGKMTLLPAYQRMLQDERVVFDAHVNATTRYLLQKSEDVSELKTIGCAGERRLEASEGSCTFRVCTTKVGATAPTEGCATICNRENHSDDDAPDCAAKCTCTASASPAERCWMLCVANLPTDQCAKSDQTCKGQAISCTKPVPAPAPTTGTPVTSAPAPPTSAPVTNAPLTNAPSTPSSPSSPSTPASNAPIGASPTPATASPGTTPSGSASTTPKPASGGATNTSSGSGANSTQSGGSASATVTTPAPTTAAPKSLAASQTVPTVAVLVTVTAVAHALLE